MKYISVFDIYGGFSDINEGDLSFYLFDNKKSRKIWKNLACVKSNSLREPIFSKQVHGNKIIEITDPTIKWEAGEADALVTSLTDIPVGVFSADCLPILMWTQQTVAAIHAGWKGSLANISAKVAQFIAKKENISPAKISASLGACIDKCCLEMGNEVYASFINNNPKYKNFFSKKDKWHLDLKALNTYQLVETGLIAENITKSNQCTYCSDKDFFSYRRQKKRNGSMFSFILKKGKK